MRHGWRSMMCICAVVVGCPVVISDGGGRIGATKGLAKYIWLLLLECTQTTRALRANDENLEFGNWKSTNHSSWSALSIAVNGLAGWLACWPTGSSARVDRFHCHHSGASVVKPPEALVDARRLSGTVLHTSPTARLKPLPEPTEARLRPRPRPPAGPLGGSKPNRAVPVAFS